MPHISYKYLLLLCLIVNNEIAKPIITNISPKLCGALQIGNAIACYSLAKILSLKYNIPFIYSHFPYHELFVFSDYEESDLANNIWSSKRPQIFVQNEQDIINNLDKDVIFYTTLIPKIDYIDPTWITEIKKNVQLKKIPNVFDLPENIETVAVHIRKGNGGGQIYDGELASIQEFDFDRKKVTYLNSFENFPFDWYTFQRKDGLLINSKFVTDNTSTHAKSGKILLDKVNKDTQVFFPPNQYYIDQIRKVSDDLRDIPLFVQIFTDDKNPHNLVEQIIKKVNKENIIFHYEDNRHLPYKERIAQDLHMMSRCNIMIRSQSTFARAAELIGDPKMILSPLAAQWEGNILIMTHIIQKLNQ